VPFGTYTIGLVIVIGALVCGARLLHVATHWIVVGWILLVGQGVLIRGIATRQRNLDIELRPRKDLLSIRPRRLNVDMSGEGPTAIPQNAGAEGPSQNGLTSA
jgi:hypothetical protein